MFKRTSPSRMFSASFLLINLRVCVCARACVRARGIRWQILHIRVSLWGRIPRPGRGAERWDAVETRVTVWGRQRTWRRPQRSGGVLWYLLSERVRHAVLTEDGQRQAHVSPTGLWRPTQNQCNCLQTEPVQSSVCALRCGCWWWTVCNCVVLRQISILDENEPDSIFDIHVMNKQSQKL